MVPSQQRTVAFLCLLLLAGGLSACSWLGAGDDVERTYPQAGNYEALPLDALLRLRSDTTDEALPDAGRYNVDAYATKLAVCPENANCYLPDAVYLGASPETPQRESYRLAAQKPEQFEVGARYTFTVKIIDRERSIGAGLLGYSRQP